LAGTITICRRRAADETLPGVHDYDGGHFHLDVWLGLVSGDQEVVEMEEGLMVLVFPFLIVWICSWPF
jgi:hypothetical protein